MAVWTRGLRSEKKGVVGLLCVKSMGDSCVVFWPVRYENLWAVRLGIFALEIRFDFVKNDHHF